MNDVLRRIVERTAADLEARDRSKDDSIRERAEQLSETTSAHRFSESLSKPGVRIIAEIKSASPSAGPIDPDPDVETIARDYAEGGAAAISVVTEPHFFHGSRGWIDHASRAAGLPVVMKDFVIDEIQIAMAVAAGADALLLLASVLETDQIREFIRQLHDYGRDALVEVHDEDELAKAVAAGARIIGVNNRDLRTFDVDLGTAERLAEQIPTDVIRVSESGIRARSDVVRLERVGYRAFLVGETLMRSPDRLLTLQTLQGDFE